MITARRGFCILLLGYSKLETSSEFGGAADCACARPTSRNSKLPVRGATEAVSRDFTTVGTSENGLLSICNQINDYCHEPTKSVPLAGKGGGVVRVFVLRS